MKGKTVGLFGTYGWGGGELKRDSEARMQQAGPNVIGGDGVSCQETPDQEALEMCEELGKYLTAL